MSRRALAFRRWGRVASDVGFRRSDRRRLRPEPLELEDRRLLATFSVTSTADGTSQGTLRWAITQANKTSGANSIDFLETGTITLTQGPLFLTNTTGTQTIVGSTGVTISGGLSDNNRIFDIAPSVSAWISGLTITNGNSADITKVGGGLANQSGASVYLLDCTFSEDSAYEHRGALANYGKMTLNNCVITGNTGLEHGTGGGVFSNGTLNMTDCTLSDNFAGGGGGAVDSVGGTLNMTDCSVTGNRATTSPPQNTAYGGGVAISASVTAHLTDCTVSGNDASDGGGVENSGTLTLTDCTLSGNSAASYGGGVNAGGTVTLDNCTITGNWAGHNAAGLDSGAGTVAMTDTIIAGNVGGITGDIGGNATGSYNLVGIGGSGGLSESNNNLLNVANPLLGTLANNGGPTDTIALLKGSPAISAGTSSDGVFTDERGYPLDSPPDIGAYQVQPSSESLVVNTTADGTNTDPHLTTLRQAVAFANTLSGTATITFAPAVFNKDETITLTDGVLDLENKGGPIDIIAPAPGLTISGGGGQIFGVDANVTATISGVALIDGGSSVLNGGDLLNAGTLTLTNCSIMNGKASYGGGIYNEGTLTMSQCAVVDNKASGHGGGLCNKGRSAVITMTNCTVFGNSASTGGGLYNGLLGDSTLTMNECSITANSAGFADGGLANAGTGTLTGCKISANEVPSIKLLPTSCGGVANSGELTLSGCTISGNTAPIAAGLDNAGKVTITGCMFTGNSEDAVFNTSTATLFGCTIAANYGGMFSDGTAALTDCTISGNSTTGEGGGLSNEGVLNLTACTISGNSVQKCRRTVQLHQSQDTRERPGDPD